MIIDDEPLGRSVILEYLEDKPLYKVVCECSDGFEGLKAIQLKKPDLIFLDIQMPRINGFEMLELIDKPPAVIFTTAFDDYAMKAFDIHAIDYLLKPFSKERFDEALFKHESRALLQGQGSAIGPLLESMASGPGKHERIVVRSDHTIRIIPVAEVIYIEADDDQVSVCTSAGSYLKNRSLSYFENSLDPSRFIRVHRSFMLNVQEILRIEPFLKDSWVAVLRSGAKIPVSKPGYRRLREILDI